MRAASATAPGSRSRVCGLMQEAGRADVIVLGGGIAGLAAAGALGRRGYVVTLLEARERLGGRIFTLRPPGWPGPVEMGAEFVHAGNPPLWRILHERRMRTVPVPPRHWLLRGRRLEAIDDLAKRIGRVTGGIQPRKMRRWSFATFMRRRAGAFSPEERDLARTFVEGFEAAPTARMSAAALADETLEDDEQFRLPGGYDRLIDGLVAAMPRGRVTVRCGAPVTRVEWRRKHVIVHARAAAHAARALVITLPLGVLQARPPMRGAVRFEPALRAKQALARRMGMGHVIRIVLRFDARRWPSLLPEALRRTSRRGFGFVHSRLDGVPVWWSMTGAPVLTGWAGGPAATALARRSKSGILNRTLRSLGNVFGVSARRLRAALAGWEIHNWSHDPYSRGAYSFVAVGADEAAEALRTPVQDTLFFAGEATADGEEVGTVHGALASGLRAAEEVRCALRRR